MTGGHEWRQRRPCSNSQDGEPSRARANGVTGKSAALLREYVGFIQGVPPPQHSGEAAARRGQDDPGGPAQAQRGGGNVGREPEDPPIANAAYFWPSEGRGRGRPRKHLDTDDNYT